MPVDDRGQPSVVTGGAESIAVLPGAHAIRMRPEMYVGPMNDPLVANLLLQEALCIALEAACKGAVTKLVITITTEGRWRIEDNGPGWPVEQVRVLRGGEEMRHVDILMTELAACRDEKPEERKHLCNNGIVVLNALSSEVLLTIWRNGRKWQRRYAQGAPVDAWSNAANGDTTRTGTRLDIVLDRTIVTNQAFQIGALLDWLKAQRPEALSIEIQDHTSAETKTYTP